MNEPLKPALSDAQRRLGGEALEEIRARWLQDHGLEKRGDVWVHWPCAKLWIVERLDRA